MHRTACAALLLTGAGALGVPVESQLLVFSKTGIQREATSPQNPRALFFDEAVVVGYIAGAPFLEVAAHDPEQGVVFYTLDQTATPRPQFTRRTSCLTCHVSGSTLEVQGMINRSVFTRPDGSVIPRLGSHAVTHRTPLLERWGGMYVTGTYAAPLYSGRKEHMGNETVSGESPSGAVTASNEGFIQWLASMPETRGYPSRESDIASWMVFDHQAHAINLLTRLNWESRANGLARALVDELADYLLFVDEVPPPAKLTPRPGFAERFTAAGPKDRHGRSLRQLDLETRLLRHPCSYMIYTDAFESLPPSTKAAVYERMWTILSGRDNRPKYAHLTAADRRAIIEILRETKTDLPEFFGAAGGPVLEGPDWSRFRGPNGSGISSATNVPTEFGPSKHLLWRLPLPPGHSSPILQGDRIYLTAFRGDALYTLAIDRLTGRILWDRGAPLVKTMVVDKRNNPASPSPAVEENGIYVFFPDYGLIAYDRSGDERWKMPLGPFTNVYGMGASPVIVGDLVVLACDQSIGSYLMAVDKRTGRVRWKVDRPEAKSGHSTPVLWRGSDGKDQILLPGSFLLTSYDAATGRKLWWVGGLSFEMKSTPVMGGDTIYVNGYGAPVNDPGNKVTVPPADEVWKTADTDGNGLLSKAEFPKFTAAFWFDFVDLDASGTLTRDEWAYYRAALDSENGMLAIRLGGSGDMTDTAIRWKYQRSVPQLPSPLLYAGALYMVNDNGIVTTLNPETGALIKQGRLTGAPGPVFASPIAAEGNIFFTTEAGAVVIVAPGGDLTVKAVNDLGEDAYATPAFADGRLYVRTTQALYAFGRN